jgi:hypothetical protein
LTRATMPPRRVRIFTPPLWALLAVVAFWSAVVVSCMPAPAVESSGAGAPVAPVQGCLR